MNILRNSKMKRMKTEIDAVTMKFFFLNFISPSFLRVNPITYLRVANNKPPGAFHYLRVCFGMAYIFVFYLNRRTWHRQNWNGKWPVAFVMPLYSFPLWLCKIFLHHCTYVLFPYTFSFHKKQLSNTLRFKDQESIPWKFSYIK